MIYDNILQTIGDTPIVKLNRTGPDHVDLYVKLEEFNPLASVKDRLAYAIIKDPTDSSLRWLSPSRSNDARSCAPSVVR